MPSAQSHTEGEFLHPAHPEAPAEAYSPEQARRHHVDWNKPTEYDLIRYGANEPWLVLHAEWYRLLTATFVHVGLWHIAANMWCLWNLGILGEPLIGPFGMIAVYLLTGIAGNLLSMASNVLATATTHNPRFLLEVGAGASGAVDEG